MGVLNWLQRVVRNLREDAPEVLGGAVQVGVEAMLEAHGQDRLGAKEIAYFAGSLARESAASVGRGPAGPPAIVRVARCPEESVTPAWFVYTLPVERGHVRNQVLSVSPRIWLSAQVAWVYAEHAAQDDLGLSHTPELISAEEPVSRAMPDALTLDAWDAWTEQRQRTPTKIGKDLPFGPYVLGEVEGAGVVAWRPVLSSRGMRAGTLTPDYGCSLTRAPLAFPDEAQARRVLAAEGLSVASVVYLPGSLGADLELTPLGLVRARGSPRISMGDPVEVSFAKQAAPAGAPHLYPELYVSESERGVVAWRPVDAGRASFARLQRADGTWGTAVWPSTHRCLEDLGRLGIWGKEQAALTITPKGPAKGSPSGVRL